MQTIAQHCCLKSGCRQLSTRQSRRLPRRSRASQSGPTLGTASVRPSATTPSPRRPCLRGRQEDGSARSLRHRQSVPRRLDRPVCGYGIPIASGETPSAGVLPRTADPRRAPQSRCRPEPFVRPRCRIYRQMAQCDNGKPRRRRQPVARCVGGSCGAVGSREADPAGGILDRSANGPRSRASYVFGAYPARVARHT